ncbi:MAG: glycosyltransferase [Verrucomicrobiae bacterium]|nr:glycosyltransferase [Verrucomicrobiae bacterium]
MKLCDVTQFYSPVSGGVKRYLSEKKDYLLRETDHEHVLIIPGNKNECQERGRTKIHTIASPQIEKTAGYRFLWNLPRLKKILLQERPDVIESGDPYQVGWKIAEVAEELNCKKVAFYHSHFPETYLTMLESYVGKNLQDFLLDYAHHYARRLYSRYDKTLVPSPLLRKILEEWGITNTVDVKLGVNTDLLRPGMPPAEIREKWKTRPDQIILLSVGRLSPEKNITTLLKSFKILWEKFPDRFYLVIVGEGPLRVQVKEVLEKTNAITWYSYLDPKELVEIYRSADLFVHPGVCETFGLVTLEAQACGLPVVGIRGGFMDRLAFADSLSYWAIGNSAEALTEAIEKISRCNLKKMGKMASEVVHGKYSWNVVLKELFEIYES